MLPTNARTGRTRLANLSRDPVIVLNLAGKETHAARSRGLSGVNAYWDVGACVRSNAGGRRRTRASRSGKDAAGSRRDARGFRTGAAEYKPSGHRSADAPGVKTGRADHNSRGAIQRPQIGTGGR